MDGSENNDKERSPYTFSIDTVFFLNICNPCLFESQILAGLMQWGL
jgi:hypothetical protein